MNESEFVFRDPPIPQTKHGVSARFVKALEARPGEWAVYRSGLIQNTAHVNASKLRRSHPGVVFIARKDEDGNYSIFGKVEVAE